MCFATHWILSTGAKYIVANGVVWIKKEDKMHFIQCLSSEVSCCEVTLRQKLVPWSNYTWFNS